MKIVYRAADIIEAEIVKGMLIAGDIDAHVSGFYLQGGIGEIAPTDLANVLVADDDYAHAEELVREYDNNQPLQTSDSMATEDLGANANNRVLISIIVIIMFTVLGYWLVI
jgi:ligand-binding sensor protein